MRLNRFIGDFDLSKDLVKITNSENIKQIKDVLRMKIGENIILSDGLAKEAEWKIISLSSTLIKVKILKEFVINESKRKVNLYLAILKKENFELAVQKAVECGVTNIIPIITERTIKTGLNISRLEKIIKEASEQCGRSILPTLRETQKFKDAIRCDNKSGGVASAFEKIIFHTNNNPPQSDESKASVRLKTISIFIGPEGGFTDKEIALAKNSNCKVFSLGSLTLRAETAAIIATYRTVQRI